VKQLNNFGAINWSWLAFLILVLLLSVFYFYRKFWFYRDPVRIPPKIEDVIISPADGKVMYIQQFEESEVFSEKLGQKIRLEEITKASIDVNGRKGWLVGIYMSPLDVHFNYAPVDGVVEKIVYTPAKTNLPMVDLWEYINFMFLRRTVNLFAHEFHFVNERNAIFLRGRDFPLVIVEIADKFVNKISCFVNRGDVVETGQKVGFIERGSQVDLVIFKEDLHFLVKPGEQVYGGKTVLAEY
jgi:phosphatidylserine decarboxylase